MRTYRVEFFYTDKKEKVLADGSKTTDSKTERLGSTELSVHRIPHGVTLTALAFRHADNRFAHANKVRITDVTNRRG